MESPGAHEASWRPPHAEVGSAWIPKGTILEVAPSYITLAIIPCIAYHYMQGPSRAGNSRQSPAKFCGSMALVGMEMISLALRSAWRDFHSDSLASPGLSLQPLTAVLAAAVFYAECCRSIQTSSFTGLFLSVGVAIDLNATFMFFRRPGLELVGALTAALAAVRAILLVLEQGPRAAEFIHDALARRVENQGAGGFWSRFVYLNLAPLILPRSRGADSLQHFSSLSPEFNSVLLLDEFKKYWKQEDDLFSHTVTITCFNTWKLLTLNVITCRIALGALALWRPFVIYDTIRMMKDDNATDKQRFQMLCIAALAFGGAGFTKLASDRFAARLGLRIRGTILAGLYQMYLTTCQSNKPSSESALSLISDADAIYSDFRNIYELFIVLGEVGYGIYLLAEFIGLYCLFVVIPMTIFMIYNLCRGEIGGTPEWNESIQRRIDKTTNIVSQMKTVKMLGLGPTVASYLQRLRELEVACLKRVHLNMLKPLAFIASAEQLTPIIVMAATARWSALGDNLTAEIVFPTLALAQFIGDRFQAVLTTSMNLRALWARTSPVEKALLTKEKKEYRTFRAADILQREEAASSGDGILQATPSVEFINCHIVLAGDYMTAIAGLNFALHRGSITGVIGTSSSVLMQGILGEADLRSGTLKVDDVAIAYWGGPAWFQSASIKDNIIGSREFDAMLFQRITTACLLEEDIECLAGGFDYLLDRNGRELSPRQRSKIDLARSLYKSLPMMLIDGISSQLDRNTELHLLHQLCGENGLLRELGTTVLIRSTLPECIDVADRFLVLEVNGRAHMEDNIGSSASQKQVLENFFELYGTIYGMASDERAGNNDNAGEEHTDDLAAGMPSSAEPGIPDSKASLYWRLIDSTGRQKLLLWTFAMFLVSLGRMLPSIYMQLWVERSSEANFGSTRYVTLAVGACLFFSIAVYALFAKLARPASLVLHKQLIDIVVGARVKFFGPEVFTRRFGDDMKHPLQALPVAVLTAFDAGFWGLIQAGVIISVAPYLAITIPFFAVAAYFVPRLQSNLSRETETLCSENELLLRNHFTDTVTGLTHIRAFRSQTARQEEATRLIETSQKSFYYRGCIESWHHLPLSFVETAIATSLMYLALFTNTMTETAVGMAFLQAMTLTSQLFHTTHAWKHLHTTVGELTGLRDFLERTPQESQPTVGSSQTPDSWPSQGVIQFHNVSATHWSASPRPATLNGISISIRGGQKVEIVGNPQSGKTSTFLTLLGFLDWTGEITIDGVDISTISRDDLRSRIVLIDRSRMVLDASVRANLLPQTLNEGLHSSALSDEELQNIARRENELEEMLTRLDLWNELQRRDGLDTVLENVGYSNDQICLLQLVRGIMRQQDTESKVVLIDDVLHDMEPASISVAQELMRENFSDCTVLTVGDGWLSGVDMTVVLDEGQVVRVRKENNRGRL